MPKNLQCNQAQGAGRWFPADPAQLRGLLDACLDVPPAKITDPVVAAIAPHAGYIYSGPVAGHLFSLLRAQAAAGIAPDTVAILGFNHRQGFNGAAVMAGATLATPLTETPLDQSAAHLLTVKEPLIFSDSRPHYGEHSAENLVPFIQVVLPQVQLLPIIIGSHSPDTRAALVSGLKTLAATKKLLVIASSDMLHDPDYAKVTRTDQATLKMVNEMRVADLLAAWQPQEQVFCGISAVATAMEYAWEQGCQTGHVLCYLNSGDTHPESRGDWVVGYSAVAFSSSPAI